MLHNLQSEFNDLSIEWEGPDGIGLFDIYFDPTSFRPEAGRLQALYLTQREVKWVDALTYCGTLDTFTPSELKGIGYYSLQAAIFCYSTRPNSIIHVPKGYEKLADYFLDDHENRRRHFREKDLVGILKDRQMLKCALQFLVNKGVLEPTGVGEFAIKRRPINKLKFVQ
jgi:hypothetical protein